MLLQPDTQPDRANTIISVQRLSASYARNTILDSISFNIARAEIFVIAGASGSGKTTLLNHMIGLLQPEDGSILIEGDDITDATAEDRRAILRRFGVMFQSGALFGSMTVLENVRLPLEEFTTLAPDQITAIARSKLALVGLDHADDLLPSQLSGGMRKRAAIARAMALDPAILFLDEPSAGLDPVTAADLDHLILDLAKMLHVTLVIVTHELASIFAIADRVLLLDPATHSVAAIGSPRWLRDECPEQWIRDFFAREHSGADP